MAKNPSALVDVVVEAKRQPVTAVSSLAAAMATTVPAALFSAYEKLWPAPTIGAVVSTAGAGGGGGPSATSSTFSVTVASADQLPAASRACTPSAKLLGAVS